MPKKKTHDEFLKEFESVSENEYLLLSNYINRRTKILIKHNVCDYDFQMNPECFVVRGQRCPKCSGNIVKTTEQFKKEVYDLCKDEYIVLDEYKNNKEKLSFLHSVCNNIYKVKPNKFLNGRRCLKCFGTHLKTTEEFKKEIFSLIQSEYEVISEYKQARKKIKFLHKKCNNLFEMMPNDFLNGRRCPVCKESKGEKTIQLFLKYNKINFKTQYRFDDLKHKKYLFFDFAIFKDNKLFCLIEYDGEFHYKKTNLKNDLESQKIRDELKNRYCLDHNIKLIRIPYTEKKNIKSILTKELLHFF